MNPAPELAHIVACSRNGVIGRDGGLPWHIPADLKFFKKTTMGHIMIMGRRTWDSIGRALPGRLTIVVSRRTDLKAEGAMVAGSLDAALELSREQAGDWPGEVFITGGGELYRQSLPLVQRIYMTLIDREVEGDTRYPLPLPAGFREVSREEFTDPESFAFLVHERRQT